MTFKVKEGISIAGSPFANGDRDIIGRTLELNANTGSTSTSTGTLVITGGIGATENLNVGGAIDAANNLSVGGNAVITGDLTVNGTTTTINSTAVSVDDINIILGDTASPSDTTANNGGITLKGATDKTINWINATDSWTASENFDIASGKHFSIDTVTVLDADTAFPSQTSVELAPSATNITAGANGTGTTTIRSLTVAIDNNSTIGGTLSVTGDLSVGSNYSITSANGNVSTNGSVTAGSTVQGTDFVSTVSTGTAPITVNSTTKVTNLNADLLDGFTASVSNTNSTIVTRDAQGDVNFTKATLSGATSGVTVLQANSAAAGTLTLPASTDTLLGRNTTDTVTNKSLDLTDNSLSGTVAEFNAALTDDDFVTLTGAENLTNKILTDPSIDASNGSFVFPTATSPSQTTEGEAVWDSDSELLTIGTSSTRKTIVDTNSSQTLTNKTLTSPVITGVSPQITLGGDLGGSVTLTDLGNATLNATIQPNSVALGTDTTGNYIQDITGTANQVIVSGSGSESSSVTLSLPQDINTAASPSFAGATLDNIQIGITTANEIDTSTGNLTLDSAGGTTTVDDNLVVSGDLTVNGTTVTVNSTTVSVDDKNIELGATSAPTDTTADGGGITLKGTTDKTINWINSTDSWTSSENFDLESGKSFRINGTSVLSGTSLGSGVVNSSLTSVGTIDAGVWQGSVISPTYGGTGVNNGANTITLGGDFTHTGSHTLDVTTTGNTNITLPTSGTVATTGNLSQFASTTSDQLAGVISDETGSGSLVFSDSPSLTSPSLGNATATTINNLSITANTGNSLTTTDSVTFNSGSIQLANGTADFGTGGTVAYIENNLGEFSATTSAQLRSVISDETGSGSLVFAGSPTLTTGINTSSTSFDLINSTATTVNFAGAATSLNIGSSSGTTSIANSLNVAGNLTVNGTTTTVNSTTVSVDDKNIELGATASPTDTTADGGGITLKGNTDKTINWINSTSSWTSSENFNLASGKSYKINGNDVLTSTTLGSGVVNSSLASLGTVSTGVWQGSVIDSTYGGTGVNNNGRTITVNTGNIALTAQSGGSSVTVPSTGTLATLDNKFTDLASVTSAELKASVTDETGTGGSLVFATNPVLTTPTLGEASATSINNVAITQPANGSTITVADGKTFTVNASLTLSGTDASSVNFGSGGTVAYTTANLGSFASTTSNQLAGVISDETGTGNLVFSDSPALTDPRAPIVYGGTGSTDTLTLRATTNNSKPAAGVLIDENIPSTSTTTGSLVVTGGLGVSSRLYAGSIQDTPIGNVTRASGAFTTLSANSSVTFNPTDASVSIQPSGTGSVNISPNTQGSINNMEIGGTTPANATFANVTISGSTDSQFIQFRITDGSAETFTVDSATGNTNVGGSLSVSGDLVVNGTTTTVNSTTVTIDDPIFTLGGDTAPSTDDNKDRGIEFRWHNGTNSKLGFFGFDDSTGKFSFIPDASNSSEVFSGTKGEIDALVDYTNLQNLAVALGTETTGSYVQSVSGDGTITVTGGTGESSTPQIGLTHLGLENLSDPNDDRVVFWDDSSGSLEWLDIGSGLTISGTEISNSDPGSAQNIWKSILLLESDLTPIQTLSPGNNNASFAIVENGAIDLTSDGQNIFIAHGDTSTVSNLSSDNNAGTVIQDINLTFDTYGHAQTASVNTVDLDTRYLTAESDTLSSVTGRGSTTSSAIEITNTTASTSTTTGALTVSGGVGINGALNATSKSFDIPHPSRENYRLRHGSLEGPEFGVYVRGRSSSTVIELPDYWQGLVDESSITVSLTAIGSNQTIWVESVSIDNILVGSDTSEMDYFYTIFAERTDIDKLEVEYEKHNDK